MQNQPPFDNEEEEREEVDPRASLINNSAATREIMMRMLSPQRFQQQQRSPMEGNYLRSHRVDDVRMGAGAGGTGAAQMPPTMFGQTGNTSQTYYGGGNMPGATLPPSGNDDELMARMMLLRQQHVAAMESNRMLHTMYGSESGQESGNRMSGRDDMYQTYGQSQHHGRMSFAAARGLPPEDVAASPAASMQQRSAAGGDSGRPFRPTEQSFPPEPDPRSPSQWRNYPPTTNVLLQQRPGEYPPYRHDIPQRLDVRQMPLQDMLWRQSMAGQKHPYDDHRAASSESPPKKKKKSRKKPADMPRRPLSAYNLFFSEERENILREISGDEDTTTTSATGAEGSSEAATDTSSSAAAAVKSEETTAASVESAQKPARSIQALLRPLVASEKKRRPHRKTHGKISFKELAKMVGQRWKKLPEDRRKYYQELANEDMKRQKVAMEEYYKKQKLKKEGKLEPEVEEKVKTDEEKEGTDVQQEKAATTAEEVKGK